MDGKALVDRASQYFKSIDAVDLEGALSHFADDATMIFETGGIVVYGKESIRSTLVDLFERWTRIQHVPKTIATDVESQRLALHQQLTCETPDGATTEMQVAFFIDFSPAGTFASMRMWISS